MTSINDDLKGKLMIMKEMIIEIQIENRIVENSTLCKILTTMTTLYNPKMIQMSFSPTLNRYSHKKNTDRKNAESSVIEETAK